MHPSHSNNSNRLSNSFLSHLAPRLRKSSSTAPLAAPDTSAYGRDDSLSSNLSDRHPSSEGHGPPITPMSDLVPPGLPFADAPPSGPGTGGRSSARSDRADASSSRRSSFSSLRPRSVFGRGNSAAGAPDSKDMSASRPMSLSINYVPAKFAKLHAPGEYAHRRKGRDDEGLVKRGGGRSAFADDAGRMGAVGFVDDDYGTEYKVGKGGLKRKDKKKWGRLRWNRFKWCLFVANTVLITYGLATLVSAILVWLNIFYNSDVIRVGNRKELIVSTIAAVFTTLTSLIGYSGIILNNRPFLAVYTFMLWICLGLIAAPGYMTYKQRTFNLEGKINYQWSRDLNNAARRRIQDSLLCCGYFSPVIEAAQSPLCYTRSNFPGCKGRYLRLEREVLQTWYTVAFSIVPAHCLIIIASLLCSNQVTYRFGKGLTPKRYRLDMASMGVIMDDYAGQIAAKYGEATAADAISRSSVHLADPDANPFAGSSRRGSSYGEHDPSAGGYGQPHSQMPMQAPNRVRNESFGASGSPLVPSTSRAGSVGTTHSTGFNSQAGALYDPRRDSYTDVQQAAGGRARMGSSLNPNAQVQGQAQGQGYRDTQYSAMSQYSEAERYRDAADGQVQGQGQAQGQGYGGYGQEGYGRAM